MGATIVELRGVRKSFGGFTALHGIDLPVLQGEFITLLGPSGCGKTTTLRIIGGFERPDAGEVLMGSSDVSNVPPNKRDVNTVFQSYALFPHLTVWDNVAFGPRMKGTPKAEVARRVGEALELVQLSALGTRKPSELSGGQQQRVALARALVNRPKVLLLDEPLASLDLQLRRRMQVELKHLQQQVGITFVFVTHDQEEALTVSDRIAVMNKGAIEQLGTPAEVYNDPATKFVSRFIGETNLIEGESGPMRTDGHATMETAFGPLRIAVERIRRTGDAGTTLSVRPERLKVLGPTVGQPGEPREFMAGMNVFDARCVEAIFLGSAVRASFVTPDGHSLDALLPVGEAREAPVPGGWYALGFGPGDCTCFQGDASHGAR